MPVRKLRELKVFVLKYYLFQFIKKLMSDGTEIIISVCCSGTLLRNSVHDIVTLRKERF